MFTSSISNNASLNSMDSNIPLLVVERGTLRPISPVADMKGPAFTAALKDWLRVNPRWERLKLSKNELSREQVKAWVDLDIELSASELDALDSSMLTMDVLQSLAAKGITLFQKAAFFGSIPLMEKLLKTHPDQLSEVCLNKESLLVNQSPLSVAIGSKQFEAAHWLVWHGADVTHLATLPRFWDLAYANKADYLPFLQKSQISSSILLAEYEKNLPSTLVTACQNPNVEMLEFLLDADIWVNMILSHRHEHINIQTPLYYAVVGDNAAAVRLLLSRKASVVVPDRSQDSYLSLATSLGHCEIVELLLRKEAKHTYHWKTDPYFHAIKSRNYKMLNTLIKNGFKLVYGSRGSDIGKKLAELNLTKPTPSDDPAENPVSLAIAAEELDLLLLFIQGGFEFTAQHEIDIQKQFGYSLTEIKKDSYPARSKLYFKRDAQRHFNSSLT